jgi:TRAP-type C4-dicarboxylate transport system substrate-binding protein
VRLLASVIALLTLTPRASADPVTLRFASVAPEGSAWARVFQSASRDIEILSQGDLNLRWVLGGIAGDETMVRERMRRGQLDGEAAGISCADMLPSLRVLRVAGMVRRREEAHAVVNQLRPVLEAEARKSGYVLLAVTWLGSDLAFTRKPVHTLDDLRKQKLWIWNLDPVWTVEMKMLGLDVVPLDVAEAGRAYDEGRIDGFLGVPTAALVYQWSARTRYYSDLTIGTIASCVVAPTSVFEALPIASQKALRDAMAKATVHFEDICAAQEDALLGGLFAKQGTQPIAASPEFRAAFLEAARAAREQLPESVVPKPLITRALGWLSDFRAERH